MSTAFYPQGMKSYNNHTNQGGYKTWKGDGAYSNPVGITAGNMRPLTNKDERNDAIYRQGSARPIKQYRRGTSTPTYLQTNGENSLELDYYSNRQVKSSVSDKIIGQMIDRPGEFSINQNHPNQENIMNSAYNAGCKGVAIVSDWAPITNLTEKPQPTTENPYLCCNAQRKAKRRSLYASTNLKKNYYTTTMSKLYNRCKTFEQKQFNYPTGHSNQEAYDEQIVNNPAITQQDINDSKPGGPLTYLNTYRGDCNPNAEIDNPLINVAKCSAVVYKPSNSKYANQGAVTGSTRMLRLNVDAINKNLANIKAMRGRNSQVYKNKAPACKPAYYTKDGNAKTCSSIA